MREIGRRAAYTHQVMRDRGDILPQALPAGRELSALELEELAWRVYTLASITHVSLVRCLPTLLVLAAEWLSCTEPGAWDAYCESQLSP